MTNRKILVAAITAAASLTGCVDTGSGSGSDEDEIKSVINASNDFILECTKEGTCDRSKIDDFAIGDAKTEMEDNVDDFEELEGLSMDVELDTTFQEITVDGKSATAEVCNVAKILSASVDGEEQDLGELAVNQWSIDTYTLDDTDDGWRISELEEGESQDVGPDDETCTT